VNALNFCTLLTVLPLTQIAWADALDTWTWRNPVPTGNALEAVAFVDGQFMAVGSTSTVLTSIDGITWLQHHTGGDADFYAVTYGSGRFVAVGNTIRSSVDGVNWIQGRMDSEHILSSVAYGNGYFVAVSGDVIAISTNATVWSVSHIANSIAVRIAHGHGEFVALLDGGRLHSSTNGVDWVPRQSSVTAANLQGIAFGSNRYAAVGDSGTVLTSADGVDWVQSVPVTTNSLQAVIFGSNQFVAVGNAGSILSSGDGMTWFPRQPGTLADLHSIAWGNGEFVAMGDSPATSATNSLAATILTSEDGTTWFQRRSPQRYKASLTGVAYGNGVFLGVGLWINTNKHVAASLTLISPDGVNWDEGGSVPRYYFGQITYGNGQFVVTGYGDGTTSVSNRLFTSADGMTWSPSFSPPSLPSCHVEFSALSFVDDQFLVADSCDALVVNNEVFGYPRIWSSTNAINWTPHLGIENNLNAVVFGNGRFIGVGAGGTILTSGSPVTIFATPKGTSVGPSIVVDGPVGLRYTVQTFADLVSWLNLTNFTALQSSTAIPITLPAASDRAFYRAYSQ
jgi:hypothetical protein